MDKAYTQGTEPHKTLSYFAPRFFILAVGVFLSIGCFFYLSGIDRQKAYDQISSQNKQRALAIASNANDRLVVLRSLRGYIEAQETLSSDKFTRQAKLFLDHYPDILAIEWAPRIPDALRPDFESSMQASGVRNYQIRQYNTANQISPSETKKSYLPVQFVVPESERNASLGLDLTSVKHWEDLLEKAKKQSAPIATPVTTIIQGEHKQKSIRIFYPVYDDEKLVKGFLTMVIKLDPFIRHTLQGYGLSSLALNCTISTSSQKTLFTHGLESKPTSPALNRTPFNPVKQFLLLTESGWS